MVDSVIFVSENGQTTALPKSGIPKPTITTEGLPNGMVGVAFSQALAATSAYNLPVTWSVSSGKLPAGLALDANTGVLGGVPTKTDRIASFTIKANNGSSATKRFSIRIYPRPTPINDIPGVNTPIITGNSTTLPDVITFDDGTSAEVTWTSGTPSVAKIDKSGKLVAVSEGTAQLTATAQDGKKQTITVTFAKPVTGVRTPLAKIYLKKGTAFTPPVCADSVTKGGKADVKALLTWTSSKPKVAAVDTATGKIKAKKAGVAKITATALNGTKLTLTVTVVGKATALKKVAVAKVPKSLAVGKTAVLKVKATPAKATNLKVTFSSSDKKVLTVDKAGKLTAVAKGKAKVTVKIGKRKVVKTVAVK
jgi:hypothetical protein